MEVKAQIERISAKKGTFQEVFWSFVKDRAMRQGGTSRGLGASRCLSYLFLST